jgi:hypothetical protein
MDKFGPSFAHIKTSLGPQLSLFLFLCQETSASNVSYLFLFFSVFKIKILINNLKYKIFIKHLKLFIIMLHQNNFLNKHQKPP